MYVRFYTVCSLSYNSTHQPYVGLLPCSSTVLVIGVFAFALMPVLLLVKSLRNVWVYILATAGYFPVNISGSHVSREFCLICNDTKRAQILHLFSHPFNFQAITSISQLALHQVDAMVN